jgi:hypothetical protein
MPGIDGVEFCKNIKIPALKNLADRQGGRKIAVQAFNQGIIDVLSPQDKDTST